MKHYGNYIDGQWVDSLTGKTQDIINPATGEAIAEMTSCGAEVAKLAVEAAQRSFYEDGRWRFMDVKKKRISCCRWLGNWRSINKNWRRRNVSIVANRRISFLPMRI